MVTLISTVLGGEEVNATVQVLQYFFIPYLTTKEVATGTSPMTFTGEAGKQYNAKAVYRKRISDMVVYEYQGYRQFSGEEAEASISLRWARSIFWKEGEKEPVKFTYTRTTTPWKREKKLFGSWKRRGIKF